MKAIEICDLICSQVTIRDLIQKYTNVKVRFDRCPCPLHGGKNNNFSLFSNDTMFKCFKCGEAGNVITFTEKYFNLDFYQAVRQLNDDFGLNIPIDKKPTLRQSIEAHRIHDQWVAENLKREERREKYQVYQTDLDFTLSVLNDQIRMEQPTTPLDEPTKRFSWLLFQREYVQALQDESPASLNSYDDRVDELISHQNELNLILNQTLNPILVKSQ